MPRATATAHIPLGSLTQRGSRQGVTCRACGSERVTSISMALTDGSPVEFTSCHRCEHRTWQEQGTSGKATPGAARARQHPQAALVAIRPAAPLITARQLTEQTAARTRTAARRRLRADRRTLTAAR